MRSNFGGSEKPQPATEAEAQRWLAQAIGEVAREWRFQMNQSLKPLGLNLSTRQVLLQLHRNPDGLAQHQLARKLGIEAPTLVPLLDRLEKRRWLARKPDPEDKRRKRVVLLAAGRRLVVKIETISVGLRQKMMRGMAVPDIAASAALLNQVRDNMLAGD